MMLNNRLTLKNENLFLTKPVWSVEIILGRRVSNRKAIILAKLFTSAFKRDIGQYELHN